MAALFGVESHTITYHLKEIYKSAELEETSTTRKIRVVQNEVHRPNVKPNYGTTLMLVLSCTHLNDYRLVQYFLF